MNPPINQCPRYLHNLEMDRLTNKGKDILLFLNEYTHSLSQFLFRITPLSTHVRNSKITGTDFYSRRSIADNHNSHRLAHLIVVYYIISLN